MLALLSTPACGGDAEPAEPQPTSQTQSAAPSCDVLALFATDGLSSVGCSGALCHNPGVSPPDLVSDGLEERLLDQPANSEGSCADETLVDSVEPANSLLLKKVNGTSACGSRMPLTNPSGLTADQLRCIEEYVELVAAGESL